MRAEDTVLQVLIITMREGIEAFLIVAITAGVLRQTGRGALLPALYWATVCCARSRSPFNSNASARLVSASPR